MFVPRLTVQEINKMRYEDLDNFDLEFNTWLHEVTGKNRADRLRLKPSEYKIMLAEIMEKKKLWQ